MVDAGLCLKEAITRNPNILGNSDVLKFTDKELTFKVFKSIEDCQEHWPSIRCEDPFYSPEYFKILESDCFDSALPLYAFVFVKDEDVPIAAYCLHKKKLKLSDSIEVDKFREGTGFLAGFKYWLQRIFFPMVNFNLMIVGNILLTGKYGFRGTTGKVQLIDYQILKRLLNRLKCKVIKTDYKFGGSLVKDFFDEEKIPKPNKTGFNELQVDPSMILHIRPDWNSMDDYLLDMKSKHRVRVKKHLKQGNSLEIRTLETKEVEHYDDQLFTLYDSVIRTSGFNMASVGEGYFGRMAKAFPGQFFIDAMFLENRLLGFYSYMIKDGALLSHFIGYDEENNKEYSIYMNILLGLIRNAIDLKVGKLFYYRTALEIKSSVGAVPHKMYMYIKHNNPIFNSLMGIIIKTFFPVPKWTPRNPFKE